MQRATATLIAFAYLFGAVAATANPFLGMIAADIEAFAAEQAAAFTSLPFNNFNGSDEVAADKMRCHSPHPPPAPFSGNCLCTPTRCIPHIDSSRLFDDARILHPHPGPAWYATTHPNTQPNPAPQIALAELAAIKLTAEKQADALLAYASGNCEVAACACDGSDKATCVRSIYDTLLGAASGTDAPSRTEILARHYASAGAYGSYFEAVTVAEAKPCTEIAWPDAEGIFPLSLFDCADPSVRRQLAAQSPTPRETCPAKLQCGAECCKGPNRCADAVAGLCCSPPQVASNGECVDRSKGPPAKEPGGKASLRKMA